MPKEPLRRLIVLLARKIKSDAENGFDGHGLSLFQYGVLKRVAGGSTTQNEVARAMGVRPPSLVPVIDWLENHRYVTRRPDSEDRRKVDLALTDQGKEILKKIPRPSSPAFEKAIRELGKANERQLVTLLEKLNDNIQ